MTTPDNDSSMPAGEIIEALSGPCNDALCVRCGARWGDHGAGSYDARCPDHSGQRWERTHFAPAVDPDYLRLHDEVAALRAERDALNEEANALSREATRLGAELGRVTTERDAMRSVVEAADAAVDADRQMYHGTAEHAEANMEATFTALYDAVDAYRLATSEQETNPGHDGIDASYESLGLTSEQEASLVDENGDWIDGIGNCEHDDCQRECCKASEQEAGDA